MAAIRIRRERLIGMLDLKYLQGLQKNISNILDMATVIVDLNGDPITEPCGFSKLCKIIRSSEIGRQNCMVSDKTLGEEAAKLGHYYISKCKSFGLLDAACPIYVDGIHIANFLMGQNLVHEIPREKVIEFANEIGVNPQELLNAYDEIPKTDEYNFEKAAKLLELFSNEVSNLAIKNLKLNDQIEKYEKYNEQKTRSFKNQILLNNVFLKFFEGRKLYDTIYSVLCDLANHFKLNKVCIYEYHNKDDIYKKTVEYKKNVKDEDLISEIDKNQVEELFAKIKNSYFSSRIDFYKISKTKTGFIIPIYINAIRQAFIYLDDNKSDSRWNDDEEKLILNITYLIGTALSKNKSENEVINSLKTLEKIIGNTDAIIYVNDLHTHELLFANHKILDGDENVYLGEKCHYVFRGKDTPCKSCKMDELLKGKEQGVDSITYDIYDEQKDKWFTVTDSIINWIDERPVHMQYAIDITEKKNYEKQIKKMAYTDSLLGVPNRLACDEDLDRNIRDAMENSKLGAVIFLDLDNFKNINDTYGHSFADRILMHITDFFNTVPEVANNYYRLGGDEFIIILHDFTKEDVDKVTNVLLERFNKPWQHKGRIIMSTASIGIAFYPTDADTCNNIIKCADTAMYKAKGSGRNKAVYFEKEFLD